MILFRGHETHSRSLIKGISWRALGSIDTFLLSWFFTSNAKAAGANASEGFFDTSVTDLSGPDLDLDLTDDEK